MSRSIEKRRGFTLLEVLIALVTGAMVLLAARAMLEQLGATGRTVIAESRRLDYHANGERLLRVTLGRLEVGTSQAVSFAGNERGTRFSTWCDVPEGWLERCTATVAVVQVADSTVSLVLELSSEELYVIRSGARSGALRYLERAEGGGSWYREWGAGITAPRAIGVVLDGDTLIFRIGERG